MEKKLLVDIEPADYKQIITRAAETPPSLLDDFLRACPSRRIAFSTSEELSNIREAIKFYENLTVYANTVETAADRLDIIDSVLNRLLEDYRRVEDKLAAPETRSKFSIADYPSLIQRLSFYKNYRPIALRGGNRSDIEATQNRIMAIRSRMREIEELASKPVALPSENQQSNYKLVVQIPVPSTMPPVSEPTVPQPAVEVAPPTIPEQKRQGDEPVGEINSDNQCQEADRNPEDDLLVKPLLVPGWSWEEVDKLLFSIKVSKPRRMDSKKKEPNKAISLFDDAWYEKEGELKWKDNTAPYIIYGVAEGLSKTVIHEAVPIKVAAPYLAKRYKGLESLYNSVCGRYADGGQNQNTVTKTVVTSIEPYWNNLKSKPR